MYIIIYNSESIKPIISRDRDGFIETFDDPDKAGIEASEKLNGTDIFDYQIYKKRGKLKRHKS